MLQDREDRRPELLAVGRDLRPGPPPIASFGVPGRDLRRSLRTRNAPMRRVSTYRPHSSQGRLPSADVIA